MLAYTKGHIGILGGTFNPIHNGHLELGIQALEQFNLDKVLVMPNNTPDYKDISTEVSTRHRVNMIKLAIQGIPDMEYSDFEINRPGITYTSDTIESLHIQYPDIQWYFIMGGDSIMNFDKWHRPDIISKLATLLVTTRNDASKEIIKAKAERLCQIFPYLDIRMEYIHPHNISSSMLRTSIRTGQNIDGAVPDSVRDYIYKNHLYHSNT